MDLVTDVLELAGGLSLVAAVVVALWPVGVALALVAAGVALVGLSAAVSWSLRRARRQGAAS